MRKALVPAFLLVLGAIVLGATVFREQLVHAATTPFQNVVVTNTPTNPVNVQQQGTANVNVTNSTVPVHEQGTANVAGTVGIDPTKNTINLGSTDSSNLASANSHLANIDSTASQLHFDNSGNLLTASQSSPTPTPVTQQCGDDGTYGSFASSWSLPADAVFHTVCTTDFYATDIVAGQMDDSIDIIFKYDGNEVLDLSGTDGDGAGSPDWQMDLSHPIHVDQVVMRCANLSSNCNFGFLVLGYTG